MVGDAIRPEDLQTLFKDAESALVVLPDNVTDPKYVANRSAMSRAITDALRDQGVATSCSPAAWAPSMRRGPARS